MIEVKKQLILVSWDTNLILVKEQMLKCSLVTEEIKSFVSESVDYILEQMDTFSKLAGIMYTWSYHLILVQAVHVV